MRQFLTVLAIAASSLVFAQNNNFRFGKVSEDELKMEQCEFYPEAQSMILGRTGFLNFSYNSDKGWQFRLEVTERKKIFKKTDKDQANVSIRTYYPKDGAYRTEVNAIKATTYNFVDGKVEKTKLTNSEKYETRINDYVMEVSFAMPNVQEGSVLEYKYTLTSDFINNLRTWFFQDDIPVAYSEFDYTIPEFFRYQINQVGTYVPIAIADENRVETFTYKWTAMGSTTQNTSTINSLSRRRSMIARNIPPVEDEPHMNNRSDVPARVEFQLKTIEYPGRPVENRASDYMSFNKTIMGWTSFGGAIEKGGFAKDFTSQLSLNTDLEKATSIYAWVSSNFTWNELNRVTSSNAGRSAFKEQTGSVADINLTLIAGLRQAGLNAHPVILSTRGNGTVHPVYPSMQDFNYVIGAVTIEDHVYLLDASAKLPFGMLPEKCLNGRGWMARKAGGQWVSLKNGSFERSIGVNVLIGDESIKSTYEVGLKGYAALRTHSRIKKESAEDFSASLAESFPEGTLENFVYSDSNTVREADMSFDIVEDFYDEDIIYINPMRYGMVTSNPFKRAERFSPIDFRSKENLVAMVKIKIPEGYSAELPKQTAVRLPEGAGLYVYSASQLGDQITIMARWSLKKTEFSPDDYTLIKQFYQMASDKNNEMIVLKKM